MSRILFRTKCLSLALMSVFALTACNKESAPTQETAHSQQPQPPQQRAVPNKRTHPKTLPICRLIVWRLTLITHLLSIWTKMVKSLGLMLTC
ncbi:hypothetical protein [Moraxella equi]|nr:hypothetical protein [Moraxella equi]